MTTLLKKKIVFPKKKVRVRIGLLKTIVGHIRKRKTITINPESIPINEIISFKFFHRHSLFKLKSIGKHRISEFNYTSRNIISKYLIRKSQISCIIKSEASAKLVKIIEDVCNNYKSFEKLKYPKAILCNAHGLYGDSINSIYVAFAKINKAKIICMQPGFIHGVIKYFDQIEYESTISDIYLSWGENLYLPSSFSLGSLYSLRSKHKTEDVFPGELIILPQVPTRDIPYPVSFYWGWTHSQFLEREENLIKTIKELHKLCKNPVYRCKCSDFDYYNNLLNSNLKEAKIESGDINKEEHFASYKKAYILYFSTALVESYYKGIKVIPFTPFGDEQLRNSALSEFKSINCRNENSRLQENTGRFIEKYAKSIDPNEFKKKLNIIICNLLKEHR